MDLHKQWEQWQESADIKNMKIALPNLQDLKQHSSSPLAKLKSNAIIKLWLVSFFLVLFSVILFFQTEPLVICLMSILVVTYLIGLIFSIWGYKLIAKEIEMDQPTVSTLQSIVTKMRKASKFEEYFAILIYPISAIAGFMIGFSLVSPLEKLLNDNTTILLMIGFGILITPLAYFLSLKLNKIFLYNYLDELQKIIEEFKT